MIKKILLVALGLTVLISAGGALFLYQAVNADIDEQFAGTCAAVPLPGSGEDIQVDHARGLAYVSVFDRLGIAKGEAVQPGMVMRLDLNASPLTPQPALQGGPELRPHGLSLYTEPSGQRHLLVINHPEDRENGTERIERYTETTPGVYAHAETFTSPLIVRANDMVAVGPRQFYVAQDVDRTSGETLTQLVYFDGNEFSVAADDIQSGGGINASADGRLLYIAETGGKQIRVASRNADGSIATVRTIALDSSPDNIDVARDGSLWVGAHANVIALAMHFIVGSNAPSQVLKISPDADNDVEIIYLNKGTEIAAGSAGVPYADNTRLLIGSITARKILACEMTT